MINYIIKIAKRFSCVHEDMECKYIGYRYRTKLDRLLKHRTHVYIHECKYCGIKWTTSAKDNN